MQPDRHDLLHLREPGAVCFVTWRVVDAAAPLTADERSIVVDALRYFDGQRYDLFGYVVMDDHVHVVVQPLAHPLSAITQSWKSFSAHRIASLRGRHGSIWQAESWDRVVRDDEELHQTVAHVAANPIRRWPAIEGYPWVHPSSTGATPVAPIPWEEG